MIIFSDLISSNLQSRLLNINKFSSHEKTTFTPVFLPTSFCAKFKKNLGATPGFGGDVEKALRAIKVPFLYMPSETDLYFPLGDARYEATFIPGVLLKPIPSLWGHTAGAASNPADAKFLNKAIGGFLGLNAAMK